MNEKEYFRLIGMDCSAKLHHRLECAFAQPEQPSEERYRVIAPNWLGECPLRDQDGLCMLHKECGANALPQVCNFYPRSLKQIGDLRLACCSGSCEAVIELLLQRDQLRLIPCERTDEPVLFLPARPGLPDQCMNCVALLQDREKSLPERISAMMEILGFRQSVTNEDIRMILPVLEEVSPEIADYPGDEQPGNEKVLENLLVNHLLYMAFPFVDERLRPADAAYGLTVLYYLLRRISGYTGEQLADAAVAVFHLAEHTPFYFNTFVLLRPKRT